MERHRRAISMQALTTWDDYTKEMALCNGVSDEGKN